MIEKRGELVWDELIPWIIGLGIIALVFVLYFVLSGKGQGIIDYLKSLFRFGK